MEARMGAPTHLGKRDKTFDVEGTIKRCLLGAMGSLVRKMLRLGTGGGTWAK